MRSTQLGVPCRQLSLPDGGTFGTNPLVCRLLKGVFQLKPSLPRYNTIWDVKTVLKHLSTLHSPQNLSLKNLTLKTTMLLALLSGQRSQTLQSLSIRNMELDHNKCVFTIDKLLKTTKPGKHLRACGVLCLHSGQQPLHNQLSYGMHSKDRGDKKPE